jgi:amino acid transporter
LSTLSVPPAVSKPLPQTRKLTLLSLTALIFFTVSGGAYGLEPLVSTVGPGWAIVLIIITPLFWSIPVALMVAELSGRMPEEGGYYVWVRESLGAFWALQEGWWTVCYTAVDMAIYPVLFVNYLSYFFPSLSVSFFDRWLICLCMIALALRVNWQGARPVGMNAIFNLGLVLIPFIMFVVIGFINGYSPFDALGPVSSDLEGGLNFNLLTLGLATVLWNYCGWDNVSTYAGEVRNARFTYPKALLFALPLIVLAYLLPVMTGLAITTDKEIWSEDAGWPAIAGTLAPWLGFAIAFAALISAWSLFTSQLLYVSRLPYVLALDGWFPAFLKRTRKGVPINALLISCLASGTFSALPFGKLVVIDILLYSAALTLEFAALICLRLKADQSSTWLIPGGWFTIIPLTLAPIGCALIVLVTSLSDGSTQYELYAALLMLSLGPLLYILRRSRRNLNSEI